MGQAPTSIDLFCGCGGLTEGLKQAGFRVLGAVEVDSLAAATYGDNHADVKIWKKDIRRITVAAVKRRLGLRRGDLDLLAGCPPCQGFSSIRTRNGSRAVRDPRNDLIFEFLRFVEGLLPKTVMLENVPELHKDFRLKRFCDRLRELGYECNHDVLDAADYGVPQRRRRLILLASRQGKVPFAASVPTRPTVRGAISSLPPAGTSGDPIHDFPEKRRQATLQRIRKIPKDGGSRASLPRNLQLKCHRDCDGFKDVYGRMAWDDVSPTLTAGCFNPSKGRFLHPEEDRAITMREAALLQTFPPTYKFPADKGKSTVALLIGNALPPEFVKQHALKVVEHLLRNHGCHN